MDYEALAKKYESIPKEMQSMRRWVCFSSIRNDEGEIVKVPLNPNAFAYRANSYLPKNASQTDKETWGDFNQALRVCAFQNFDGIGFELYGSGLIVVDLDNTKMEIAEKDFHDMTNDFFKIIGSYSEWNASENGIHIFVYSDDSSLAPQEAVTILKGAQFVAMTGDIISKKTLQNDNGKVASVLAKYAKKRKIEKTAASISAPKSSMADSDIISKCGQDKDFASLWDGDTSILRGDKKLADSAFCDIVSSFTRSEKQIDAIYRKSGLFSKEWDEPSKSNPSMTYGKAVIEASLDRQYAKIFGNESDEKGKEKRSESQFEMNINEAGDPIFRIPDKATKYQNYPLNDTGNAQRFYDLFGSNFKWNATDKVFMFWTGKSWIIDTKSVIRKYANKMIELMEDELSSMDQRIEDADDDKKKALIIERDAYGANLKRLSNKSGKDAMLSELSALGEMAVVSTEFDKNPTLLNTDSGVVDLTTGKIMPFDKQLMLKNNTNTAVSFKEPKVFITFLRSIFERGNEKETDEIIECIQRCLGYTLTGLTSEQVMFLLHGAGSNGKSTLATVIQSIMGDYWKSIDSSQLMVQKNQSVAVQYSLAELMGSRYVSTQETDVGAKLSESVIKQITGGDAINAQKKYGTPFQFNPSFKVWMMTNNLPIIRGTDYGIWRRIFLIPFKKQFTDKEKDKEMPQKLAKEYPQILGWCIQGAVKYFKDNDLHQPLCLKRELLAYQKDMDVISKFLLSECHENKDRQVSKNEMYTRYKTWCQNNNEYAMAESKFRDEMVKKGYPTEINERTGKMFYAGVELQDTETDWTEKYRMGGTKKTNMEDL